MTENVWVVELKVKVSRAEFRALVDEMVAAVQASEPGALNYDWFLSDDGRTCHIYEQYADAKAVKNHLANFQENFAERFGQAVEMTAFTLYGDPNQEVRDALEGLGVEYMVPIGRVRR